VDGQIVFTKAQWAMDARRPGSLTHRGTPAFSLDGGRSVAMDKVAAAVWSAISDYTAEADPTRNEIERRSLRLLFVQALSSTWLHGPYCAQGAAQRLLEVIENVNPAVKFPPQTPTLGHFLTDFGQELNRAYPAASQPPTLAQMAAHAKTVLQLASARFATLPNSDPLLKDLVQQMHTYLQLTYPAQVGNAPVAAGWPHQ
jgi:hypothetical protein